MAALEVVRMTTSSAANDENFIKMIVAVVVISFPEVIHIMGSEILTHSILLLVTREANRLIKLATMLPFPFQCTSSGSAIVAPNGISCAGNKHLYFETKPWSG